MNRKSFVASAAAIFAAAASFAAEPVEGERSVFAHYMTCFGIDRTTARKEISIAKMYGLDGFALNCGEWQRQNGDGWDDTAYVGTAKNLFSTAQELGGFKLFFSPDGGIGEIDYANHAGMGTQFHDDPALFHFGGRPVISGWNGGMRPYDKYPRLKEVLTEKGCGDYLIIPSYVCTGYAMFEPVDFLQSDIYDNPAFVCDGIFFFGCDNTDKETCRRIDNGRFAAMKNGKLFMAGPCPSYNSANMRDHHGMQGYAEQWRTIVADQPELVEVVTWNDNAEDSGLFSSGWSGYGITENLDTRLWMARDEAFLDLTAYFAAAYKSRGIYPEITQDKLYAAYRTRPKWMTKFYRGEEQGWVDGRDRYMQIHDDVEDNVYASVMLTAPAKLSIVQGDSVVSKEFPAGFNTLSAPMVPGATPEFIVERDGEKVIETVGRRQIVAEANERNSASFEYDGIHRSWSQCAVAGAPAATFDVAGEVMDWELPAGFVPGSYTVRVRYSNDTAEEARYTFYVDLPWVQGIKHRFPLYLPPTGGKEKELCFLWSVLDGATNIRIARDQDLRENKKFDFSDWGGATIKSVSLVPNQVAKFDGKVKPAVPQMIDIPGGSFTMAAKPVEPDEGPAREVTLAPFAIGKYEVTNREFEEFRPEHRELRTAISWRDDEPVVFVNWNTAVEYCNWLSEKEGLTPAYGRNEANEFVPVDGANGYRLPTEAEWEYVASGRGENRTYPWGEDEPTREICNAAPKAEANRSTDLGRPLHEERVAVVGSYPLDCSRDGVMDMGGNVGEWCADSYHQDTVPGGENPCDQRPPAAPRVMYRSIRGGTFGYYGTPRCCDREFNSPGYPGYIYYGFRVARSLK